MVRMHIHLGCDETTACYCDCYGFRYIVYIVNSSSMKLALLVHHHFHLPHFNGAVGILVQE